MRWLRLPTLLITVLFFAACGPRGASVEPALPTSTPVPTFTSTPAGPAPATGGGQSSSQTQSQPAATPVPPAATATPEAPTVTIGNVLMNVRGGPGTNYNVIGTASPGQQFRITGKNPGLGDWWQIDYSGRTGWVFGQLVTATNAETVQVALVIPAPPPPTATPIPPTPVPVPTQPPAPRFPYSLMVNQRTLQCLKTDSRRSSLKAWSLTVNNNPKNEVCRTHCFWRAAGTPNVLGAENLRRKLGVFTPFGQGTS